MPDATSEQERAIRAHLHVPRAPDATHKVDYVDRYKSMTGAMKAWAAASTSSSG